MTDNTGPISIDSAVEALTGAPEVNNEPEDNNNVDTSETNSEADPLDELQIEDSDAADEPSETDIEDDGAEENDGEDDESQLDPIDAPEFWEAEDKDAFKSLSREAQELIAKQDQKGRAAVSKQIEQASIARKHAEVVAKTMHEKSSQLEQLLEHAAPVVASRWANVDWTQYFATNPQEAAAARQQFDRERAALQQIMTAKDEADQVAQQDFIRTETERLTEMAKADPVVRKLLDPNKGPGLKNEVAQYLVGQGIEPTRLNNISAAEMALATKAKLYDDLIAKQNQKMTTVAAKKNTGTQSTKMRPAAAPAQPQSQNRVESQRRRLGQTGSVDDAVNLLLMQSQTSKKRK